MTYLELPRKHVAAIAKFTPTKDVARPVNFYLSNGHHFFSVTVIGGRYYATNEFWINPEDIVRVEEPDPNEEYL